MTLRIMVTLLMSLVLAGCGSVGVPERADGGADGAVPERVRAIAAPYQDLSTSRLREEDGCYWYRHVGPVETTLLPLRTVEGRPICARPQGTAAAVPAEAVSRAALSPAR